MSLKTTIIAKKRLQQLSLLEVIQKDFLKKI